MKKILLIIIFVLFVVGGLYYYNKEYKSINFNKQKEKEKTEEKLECAVNYSCVKINNKVYNYSDKKSIDIKDAFNHETETYISGKIEINKDGKLVFIDENGKVIKTYNEIEGNVVSIDSVSGDCDLVVVALNDKADVYKTEIESGLFTTIPFYKIESLGKINKISFYGSNEEVCDMKLTGVNEKNEVMDLLNEF